MKIVDYSSKLNVINDEWTDSYTRDFYIFDLGGYFMYGLSLTAGFDTEKIEEGTKGIWS